MILIKPLPALTWATAVAVFFLPKVWMLVIAGKMDVFCFSVAASADSWCFCLFDWRC